MTEQLKTQLVHRPTDRQPNKALVDLLNRLAERSGIESRRRLELSKEAYTFAVQLGYAQGCIRSLVNQARLQRRPAPEQTLEALFEALELLETVDSPLLEAAVYHELGVAYAVQGRFPEALAHMLDALRLYRHLGDQDGEAKTLNNLGMTFVSVGRPELAIPLYRKVLSLFQAADNKPKQVLALNNLADGYRLLDDYEQARASAEEGLVICQELKRDGVDTLYYVDVLATLATILCDLGAFDRAEHAALLAHRENHLPDGTIRDGDIEAELQAILGRLHQARRQ